MSIKRCIPSQPGLADIGRIFLVSLIMVMIGGNRQAWAQATKAGSTRQAATRPDKPVKLTDCVSAECHANIKASQVLHSPVASNTCDTCHEVASVQKHTFTIRRQKAEMCTYCHEFSLADLPAVHKPVAEGDCLGCHDPHGGSTRMLVREKTTVELCGRCHDKVNRDKAMLHGPVAQGACDACHPPHAARFPKLLDVAGPDLCLSCHHEFEPAVASATFKHKAMEQGCAKCHDAHGSNAPMDLVKPVAELCLGCHEKIKEKMNGATVQHSAMAGERSCLNCHASHASNAGKLLTELPAKGCLKCHDKPIKLPKGEVVGAVPEVAKSQFTRHGEIRDGQCAGCHDVHGGQRAMLLTKPYTTALYQQFQQDNYALCFGCHDVQLALSAKTTKATNFRNGSTNLHYVHANSGTGDKNCRVCHVTHASADPRLIRKTVKYGKWDLPIGFQKTSTGGSCTPGCHELYGYDREHPLPTSRPATMPSTQAATLPVRAEREEARIINWSAQTIDGAALQIPDKAGQATVLILLESSNADNKLLLTQLQTRVPQLKDLQVVVILSGPKAAENGKSLAVDLQATHWPVVADGNHDAAHALGVQGWPLVLVLRSNGLEVARLTGGSEFLAIKLGAYVDLISGRSDETQFKGRLNAPPVNYAGPTTRLSRDLRAVRLLLDEAKAAEALALLDRGSRELQGAGEAMLLRAEALLLLKRPDDALTVISRMPAGVATPLQLNLLRARAMIALENWSWARSLLEDSVARAPENKQAHRLLGQVYEHDQNWAKAAEQYRQASEETKPISPKR